MKGAQQSVPTHASLACLTVVLIDDGKRLVGDSLSHYSMCVQQRSTFNRDNVPIMDDSALMRNEKQLTRSRGREARMRPSPGALIADNAETPQLIDEASGTLLPICRDSRNL